MKKTILYVMISLLALSILSCTKKSPDLDELFDNKSGKVQNNLADQQSDKDGNNSNTQSNETPEIADRTEDNPDTEKETAPAPGSDNSENTSENDDTKSDDAKTEDADDAPVPEDFSHSDSEIQIIKSRYIDAENFYYSMLYQQFDLDSYDVIEKQNADGYSNKYHRVLYYDINTLEELRGFYRKYFTDSFISGIDFNSYIEENGKLYCAKTQSSPASSNAKYIYTAESIDRDSAYVIRSQAGGASQKIRAEKTGDTWYFTSVAIG